MEEFTGAFIGVSVLISDDRKNIHLHFSVNDGCFCIDTQEMHFKIKVQEGESKIRHQLSVLDRETADDTARWSLNLQGEITLPHPLHCDHVFEPFYEDVEINEFLKRTEDKSQISTADIKDLINASSPLLKNSLKNSSSNIYKTLIDHLHRTLNLSNQRHENWRICSKCDRVSFAKDSISLGTAQTEKSDLSEQVLEYEIEHYEDTSYRMLCLALSHLFDSFVSFLNLYVQKNKLKIVAIGYPIAALKYQLINKLQVFTWMHLDAIPCFFETTREDMEWVSDSFSRRAARLIGYNNLVRICIGEHNCVGVDSDCIGLYGLNGYRTGLFEVGDKNPFSEYQFDTKTGQNRSPLEEKTDNNTERKTENKTVKENENTSLKPVKSKALNEEGYECLEINEKEKICYKTVNPFDFDRTKYSNEYGNLINDLIFLSKSFKNKKISFLSSTPQGGGVALMRHAHIRMYRLLGMKVSWYVTVPVNKIYEITKKKFHNILQGVYLQEYHFQDEFTEKQRTNETVFAPNCLNDQDKEIYQKWIKQNSDRLWNESVFKESDIIVLDDHQTCGFAPKIKEINPKCKIIYRSHIQIRGELYESEKAIKDTWDYISGHFFDEKNEPIIDLFLAHPMNSLIPSNIPKDLISYLPPSTDLLDGLNKKMSTRICNYYQEIFNKACFDSGCEPIDLSNTEYLLQISRFDPSKGLIDCIDVFHEVCKKFDTPGTEEGKKLHLILAGHGSVDDPEGMAVFNYLKKYISKKEFENIRHRIKLVKVPPLDQCLNLLMTKAKVVLQLSKNEGFEVKVTEALLHEKPIVVSDAGGIPLQVFDGLSGFICQTRNEMVEKVLFILQNYEETIQKVKNTRELGLIHTTPFNIMGWIKIFEKILSGEKGNGEVVYESIIKKYFKNDKQKMLLEKRFRSVL